MLEQARKFRFGALMSFLDDAISEKLSLSPSSTFRFLFLSSSTFRENQASFYQAAIHFEVDLAKGEKRILMHHRHKQIFRYVVENGRPVFFKKLVEDIIED